MMLKFTKNETIVNVEFIDKDDSTSEFSYIEMVKRLYEDKKAEDPEFAGEFTDEEKSSVVSLISDINEQCFMPENVDNSSSIEFSEIDNSEQREKLEEIVNDSSLPFDL